MQFLKKRLPLILQCLVSMALLGWIFRDAGFRAQAWKVLTTAHPGWLVAGFAAAGVGNLLGIVRWGIFLRMVGIPLGGWDTTRLSFVGMFFNNFLVGAVGGDAVKAIWLAARGHKKSAALLSVLMDRMSGLGALVICSLGFILWRLEWLSRSSHIAGVMKFVFAYLIVVVLLLSASFVISMNGRASRLPAWVPGRDHLREFTAVYMKFVTDWPKTLLASAISLIILLAYFLTFYCSARAFGVQMPVGDFFALMPAVDIISALPVSLGGFGVREQLFVTLLGDLANVPAAEAVSTSLGGALLYTLWGVFGLAFLPSFRRAKEKAAP